MQKIAVYLLDHEFLELIVQYVFKKQWSFNNDQNPSENTDYLFQNVNGIQYNREKVISFTQTGEYSKSCDSILNKLVEKGRLPEGSYLVRFSENYKENRWVNRP